MTQEQKIRIFGVYLGCECVMTSKNDPFRRLADVGFETNVSATILHLIKDETASFQLFLKPLSDITDEDAIEVAIMLSNYSDFIEIERRENEIWCTCDDNVKVVIGIVKFCLIGKCISPVGNMLYDGSELINAIDYLRSKGYMLPYADIEDLFEAGIAIKKETA